MEVTKEFLAGKLRRWENYMLHYDLPTWAELPDLELYMDQVVALVTRYLDILPQANLTDAVITPSTVNNYVRMKVMPAPVRKKYTRVHLAYLILICLLKQSLTLSEIQIILPMDLPESDVRVIYDSFVTRIHDTSRLFINQVKAEAEDVLKPGNGDGRERTTRAEELMLTTAVSSVLYRLLATKLLNLQGKPQEAPKLPGVQAKNDQQGK